MNSGLANYVGYASYKSGEVETHDLTFGADLTEIEARYGVTVVKVVKKDTYQEVTFKGSVAKMSWMATEFYSG